MAMETFDCIATKLDVREYDQSRRVPGEVKLKTLEAARLTGSGKNTQHWRFILIQERDALKQLARDSTTGKWVESCDFAVIVLTDPNLAYYSLDAGRAVQDMQLAAWNYGVTSRLFTLKSTEEENRFRSNFRIPVELKPTVVVGFGYAARKVTGKRKDRRPLEEVVFLENCDNKWDLAKIH